MIVLTKKLLNKNFINKSERILTKAFSFYFLATILTIAFSGNIQADSSKAKLKALRELIELEVDMLESSIDLTKESKDANKTINLYENLVELFCFSNTPTKNEEQSCEKYKEKLKSFYPESIYLKCLEFEDKAKCSDLFSKQIILSVSNFERLENDRVFKKGGGYSNQRFIDLRLKLEQFHTKGNLKELKAEIKEINEALQYDETQAVEVKKKLREKYRLAIPNACKTSNVYYTKKEFRENDNFLAPKKVEIIIDKDLKAVGNSFLGLEDSAVKKEKYVPLSRVKILTDSCLEVLKSSYKFDKSITEIHCFLKSFIVPECKASVGNRAYISRTGSSF